jgi:hypothetical protein
MVQLRCSSGNDFNSFVNILFGKIIEYPNSCWQTLVRKKQTMCYYQNGLDMIPCFKFYGNHWFVWSPFSNVERLSLLRCDVVQVEILRHCLSQRQIQRLHNVHLAY